MTRDELRDAFGQDVHAHQIDDFLDWLAKADKIAEPIIAPMQLNDFRNPGWASLFEQDATPQECIDELRGIDFEFETLWLEWTDSDDAKAQSHGNKI